MKIIFFGGIPKKSVKDLLPTDITGTAALYSYFLRNEFNKMGIETEYCPAHPGSSPKEVFDNIKFPKGDHIISMAQRGFTVRCKMSARLLENAKKAIRGKITSICDHATANPKEDIIFYAVPYRPLDKNVYVGWACDHSFLTPEKTNDTITILIDHAYYGKGNSQDITAEISKECLKFQTQYTTKPIIIRRFSGPDGVETVTSKNWDPGIYDRTTSMPYPNACKEYKNCDIFIVTHPESLGLSVLESAASGAYILCPTGYIKSAIISQVRGTIFDKSVPLFDSISRLDINKSIDVTKKFTWTNMANKILKSLEE